MTKGLQTDLELTKLGCADLVCTEEKDENTLCRALCEAHGLRVLENKVKKQSYQNTTFIEFHLQKTHSKIDLLLNLPFDPRRQRFLLQIRFAPS